MTGPLTAGERLVPISEPRKPREPKRPPEPRRPNRQPVRRRGGRLGRVFRRIVGVCLALLLLAVLTGGGAAWVAYQRFSAGLPDVAGLIATKISFEVMAFGIAVALGVGFLGALYPAYRGAQLQPTEALRHE